MDPSQGIVTVTPEAGEDVVALLETHWSGVQSLLAEAPGIH